jgi:hypothetical protein
VKLSLTRCRIFDKNISNTESRPKIIKISRLSFCLSNHVFNLLKKVPEICSDAIRQKKHWSSGKVFIFLHTAG